MCSPTQLLVSCTSTCFVVRLKLRLLCLMILFFANYSAYTVWNFMFVYNNYPYSFGRHTAVLMAPLTLVCHSGWDTWLQARGYTLAFYFMIRCTVYDKLRAMTDVTVKQSVEKTRTFQVVSFACVVILLALNNLSSYMTNTQDSRQETTCAQNNVTWVS